MITRADVMYGTNLLLSFPNIVRFTVRCERGFL